MPGAARDLWPSDISSDEILSPLDILRFQAEQLANRTGSLLSADVVRSETADRVSLVFEVYAPRIDRRLQLFTVQHRKNFDYPAAITAHNEKLPNYLQEKYYQPGPAEVLKNVSSAATIASSVFTAKGRWVENDQLASSPIEFTDLLSSVLSEPTIKASVLSLISKSNEVGDSQRNPEGTSDDPMSQDETDEPF